MTYFVTALEKTTPTPWTFGNPTGITGPTVASINGPTVAGRKWGHEIVTRGYETLCICPNQGIDQHSKIEGSGAANAALIVRAVNSHAALVKALEAAKVQFAFWKATADKASGGTMPNIVPSASTIAQIDAALSQAEG